MRDVLFEDCAIERTSYVPPADVDAYARGVGNTITINEFGHLPDSGHVEGITFRDCHLGASNGTATGALRMMMEAFTWSDRSPSSTAGGISPSTAARSRPATPPASTSPTDSWRARPRHSAHGVLITGCTFLGARRDETWRHGGLPIVYEGPTGIVIRDNLFYASPQNVIGGSHIGKSTDSPGLLIQGNTFDMTSSPGGLTHQAGAGLHQPGRLQQPRARQHLPLRGRRRRPHPGGGGHTVFATVGNVIKGNTFTDTRASGGEPTIVLTEDYGLGCYDNRITANTIRNRGAGDAGVIHQATGDGANYATGNLIDCGSSPPFVVVSGTIVRRGNLIVDER